ncbi:MAG TPA: TIGR04282 family arsenosugar biosynthesis glycosyltransferase [Lamprocystis sp. (in: g-proteobacteria)]|nr:TIGR04282 family arsenosugar biosynthesis glycosyltransferase [Lamprocystis sp. (in: g-proteobacteria)]
MPAQWQGQRKDPARGCALDARILVFGRAPVAGAAKTRLIPALGAQGAARLHQRLLEDTVGRLCAAGLARVELWVTPDDRHPCFVGLAAHWPLDLHIQQGPDLGARLAHAARSALTRAAVVILVGTDCPGLSPDYLSAALAELEHRDAVLGPALDGGYCLLGLRSVDDTLFERMPWGSDQVAELTGQRLDALGWPWSRLAPLRDIDRPEDLVYLPAAFGLPPPALRSAHPG